MKKDANKTKQKVRNNAEMTPLINVLLVMGRILRDIGLIGWTSTCDAHTYSLEVTLKLFFLNIILHCPLSLKHGRDLTEQCFGEPMSMSLSVNVAGTNMFTFNCGRFLLFPIYLILKTQLTGTVQQKIKQPINPDLSMEGINCMACYGKQVLQGKSTDLNSNIENMSHKELCKFLSTPQVVPQIDLTKLAYVPNPSIDPLPGAKVVYPPEVPLNDRIPPNGKVVLVVGGAKNIGKGIAEKLSAEGFTVIATSSHPDCYARLPRGTKYVLSKVPLDVRSTDNVKHFFDTVIKPIGSLYGMICLPGLHWMGPMSKTSGEDLSNYLNVKLIGSQRCVKEGLPYLRKVSCSKVLFFASVANGENMFTPFLSGYNISNRALVSLNDNLMAEERILYAMGLIESPVSFSAIEPSYILSTIGTYMLGYPTDGKDEITTKCEHMILSYAQSGLSVLTPADPVSLVAAQIFNILSAPQPGVRYIVGDPNNTSWMLLMQTANTESQDFVINNIAVPNTAQLMTTEQYNMMRLALLQLYCSNGKCTSPL